MLSGLTEEAYCGGCTDISETGEPIERSIELPHVFTDTVTIFGREVPYWILILGAVIVAGTVMGSKK